MGNSKCFKWVPTVIPIIVVVMVAISVCGCGDGRNSTSADHPVIPPEESIKTTGAVPAWSPDGEWIAVGLRRINQDFAPGIYLIRPDGTDFHYLNIFNPPLAIFDICWSPDNHWLVFAAGIPYGSSNLYKVRPDGDSLLRLTDSGTSYECACSPTEPIIATDTPPHYGIWLMNLDGSNIREFIPYGSQFDFSGSDSLVYITAVSRDTGAIRISSIDGTGGRDIFVWRAGSTYTFLLALAVNRDGNRLALKVDGQINLMHMVDGTLNVLTTVGGNFPDWSPDGDWIVYNEPGYDPPGGTLWIMRSDGTGRRLLLDWKNDMVQIDGVSMCGEAE